MLAQKNPYIANAAQTVYRVTEDERIRQMCEAREEGEKTQRTIELLHQMELQQAKEELQKTTDELQKKRNELQQTTNELQQTTSELQQTTSELQQKDAQLAAALARIAELERKNAV